MTYFIVGFLACWLFVILLGVWVVVRALAERDRGERAREALYPKGGD